MLRSRTLLGTLALTLLSSQLTLAGEGCAKPFSCGEYDCGEACQKVCKPTCEWTKVKKKCWEVECKDVCVPPVKLPSFCEVFKSAIGMRGTVGALPTRGGTTGCTSCGDECRGSCGTVSCSTLAGCNNGSCLGGGRVRTVRVLKGKTTEVEKMVVKWDVQPAATGCGKGCAPNVSLQGCAPRVSLQAPAQTAVPWRVMQQVPATQQTQIALPAIAGTASLNGQGSQVR